MKNQHPSDRAVLGVFVSSRMVEAVLLRRTEEHVELIRRIARPRARRGETKPVHDLSSVVPGLKSAEDSDFTLQVGAGNSSSGASGFLESEFNGVGETSPGAQQEETGSQTHTRPFTVELKEILTECRSLGYKNPRVAFCIGAPDVSYVELRIPKGDGKRKKDKHTAAENGVAEEGPPSSAERKRLLPLLDEKHPGAFDGDRVAFLRMTPAEGRRRWLALVPEADESVTATLRALRAQQKAPEVRPRLLETEVSLYAALARRSVTAAEEENTAVVRVGTEDTLILFLSGSRLRHFERLRSLTSFDSPETVCSRILLQQDEQQIHDLHHVLVLGRGRTEQLLQGFRTFYPDAAVESLQGALLERFVDLPDEAASSLKPGSLPAVGAALRLMEDGPAGAIDGPVDLLEKKMRRKQRKWVPAFAWHTAVVLLLVFAAGLFFVRQYGQQAEAIDRLRAEQRQQQPIQAADIAPSVLQARVDSLNRAYQRYTHALSVLDSLLVGSTQWSRMLEQVSRATRDLPNIWLESWSPQGGTIEFQGKALSRTPIIKLARRFDGTIQRLSYADIRDVRVYPFTITAPLPEEMPRVALYLRAVALGDIRMSDSGAAVSSPEDVLGARRGQPVNAMQPTNQKQQ